MPSVAPIPWPDSMYHSPFGWIPAFFHSDFSRLCVPELSPRETNLLALAATRFIASALLLVDLILAGSFAGPRMMKSLYMTRRRFGRVPSGADFFSRLRAG